MDQYGKVFQELGHIDDQQNPTDTWYQFRNKGYQKIKGNRHPDGTKTNEVRFVDARGHKWYVYLTPVIGHYLGQNMDYITSRKKIYVPVYQHLIAHSDTFKALRDYVDAGNSVQILDYDGPDLQIDQKQLITIDFLKQKINDPTKPFGHGYVIAALLADIDYTMYTN